MTIQLEENINIYNIYSNVEELFGSDYKLIIKSLYSNTNILVADLDTISSNDRYTHFQFNKGTIDLKNDINGIYEYTIKENDDIIDKGLVKIVNKGNELPTISYKSNNEQRKSKVLYRPKN